MEHCNFAAGLYKHISVYTAKLEAERRHFAVVIVKDAFVEVQGLLRIASPDGRG